MELRPLPKMIYAAIRAVGPYQETAGPAFSRVMQWARGAGVINERTLFIGLSWDEPGKVPDAALRYDAAVTVDRPIALTDGMHVGALPAMTWALATHRGSYRTLGDTFGRLMADMATRHDFVPVDLCAIEIYRSPMHVPEDERLTDLGFPVVSFG